MSSHHDDPDLRNRRQVPSRRAPRKYPTWRSRQLQPSSGIAHSCARRSVHSAGARLGTRAVACAGSSKRCGLVHRVSGATNVSEVWWGLGAWSEDGNGAQIIAARTAGRRRLAPCQAVTRRGAPERSAPIGGRPALVAPQRDGCAGGGSSRSTRSSDARDHLAFGHLASTTIPGLPEPLLGVQAGRSEETPPSRQIGRRGCSLAKNTRPDG
jgi:hypothetical protein